MSEIKVFAKDYPMAPIDKFIPYANNARTHSKENAHVALDQAEYQKRYDALVARFDTAKARQDELAQKITDRKARRQRIEMFLTDLQKREPLTVFRDEDWLAMVDHVTVSEDSGIMVTFKDGTEIEA